MEFHPKTEEVQLANALSVLLAIILFHETTTGTNCLSAFRFFGIALGLMGWLASTNLMIRTMVVWSMSKYCVVPLCALSMGQFALVIHGAADVGSTNVLGGCKLDTNAPLGVTRVFIYTICVDCTILALSAYRLVCLNHKRSKLTSLLFKDGLVYFLIV